MSATMARQGGRVQLEQSDMRLAFNMAKMAKGEFSRAAIEEMQQLIKKPGAEVQE
jgi:histone H3/H4